MNDEESYPWLLQEQLPEYEVVNFGVEGYCTIHFLLQFRKAIKEKRPKVAVLAYLSFQYDNSTRRMLSYLQEKGTRVIDISVDPQI